jgi:hypothetical protein
MKAKNKVEWELIDKDGVVWVNAVLTDAKIKKFMNEYKKLDIILKAKIKVVNA